MNELNIKGQLLKNAARAWAVADTETKNRVLSAIADALVAQADSILKENEQDLIAARENGLSVAMQDRLLLTKERIEGIADGVRKVIDLPDPVGEVTDVVTRPNGLRIETHTVPLGVIGIIYEARPNVTVDSAVLCLKAGNAVFLRGGKEATRSNAALVACMKEAIRQAGMPEDAIQLLSDQSRETAKEFMRLNAYLDVLIPRGGAGLIRAVVEQSTVPVIETGSGNCHVYVDDSADLPMALSILINAKCSRPSVCNAAETLMVHQSVAEAFFALAEPALKEQGVEVRGCAKTCALMSSAKPATDEDFYTEYNDLILSVKVVENVDEAITHINTHSTRHSEAIITKTQAHADAFVAGIDSAAVYVNASTRFTDGFEFGFGAEIGISTQKLHARGPMGLRALTSYRYQVYGDGQIR
ncbi:MAG: glutamate-5-semialdehyde dehydrogenase [Clostridia bacterium]|nr:glutamate-5-semialdehyde dehydrogenase [Clostridia bacterium]